MVRAFPRGSFITLYIFRSGSISVLHGFLKGFENFLVNSECSVTLKLQSFLGSTTKRCVVQVAVGCLRLKKKKKKSSKNKYINMATKKYV